MTHNKSHSSKQKIKSDWGISKFNIVLAIIISLIGLFQFIQGVSNTYAKTEVVENLQVEMRINFLEQDERYYQNQIWALEDRFGVDNLKNCDPSLPPEVIQRYREYNVILFKIRKELQYLKQYYYRKHGFGSEIYKN